VEGEWGVKRAHAFTELSEYFMMKLIFNLETAIERLLSSAKTVPTLTDVGRLGR
jgi:hypothetical protein